MMVKAIPDQWFLNGCIKRELNFYFKHHCRIKFFKRANDFWLLGNLKEFII